MVIVCVKTGVQLDKKEDVDLENTLWTSWGKERLG